ncbi:response regulator [Candidatus Magnetomonas plexicatena]|uniref:response regulator n=1 Tax=Candidatus Magnetomonas plexicatena TaxID=2552947 RepID=UPI001C769ECB|nr:response regulator [Nitrospirales bacterium LBB_01]
MRILIAEDDFASRTMLQRFLEDYGDVDVTINGEEAVDVFNLALDDNEPYELICLDIEMPEMDGLKALKTIRDKEKSMGVRPDTEVKIVMTTSKDSTKEVLDAYYWSGCNDYLTKPIDLQKLTALLQKYGFSKE